MPELIKRFQVSMSGLGFKDGSQVRRNVPKRDKRGLIREEYIKRRVQLFADKLTRGLGDQNKKVKTERRNKK